METIENRYETRQSFINELAFAMNANFENEQYLDLTQQIISFIQRQDYSWGKKWPVEGDEVILVDRIPSWESYHQMEEFADSLTDIRISRELYKALSKRHPFSAFRYAAEQTRVIQQWYEWRDRWQSAKAEEWMRENGLDFKDGRIISDGKHTSIWSWEDEELDFDYDDESFTD